MRGDLPARNMETSLMDEVMEQAPVDQWRCESCGHQFTAPWPKDREKFYASAKPRKCKKCGSQDAMPTGF